jgi:carbon starvation protein CstA
MFWTVIIFIYYFISTIVPIDKIIGKIYPFFGAILMFMAFGVGGAMILNDINIPELTSIADITNPKDIPIWPALFFTISCGAISGFHATQSPLMARTIKNEKLGKRVFYGAMITEAIIAMIWAAVGMSYFPDGVNGLNDVISTGGPGLVVNQVTVGYLGVFGGIVAILGVIVAPITSGDTAFRSIRLSIADRFNLPQTKIKNRLAIALPIFITAFLITQIGFDAIWMYFTFTNQLLATFTLWTGTAFLYQHGRNFYLTATPALFMSGSVVGYILTAKEFPFGLDTNIAIIAGIITVLAIFAYLLKLTKKA